jgi:hypothetical protein
LSKKTEAPTFSTINPSLQSVANNIAQTIQNLEQRDRASTTSEKGSDDSKESGVFSNGISKAVPMPGHISTILKHHRAMNDEQSIPKDGNTGGINMIPNSIAQQQPANAGGTLSKTMGSKASLRGSITETSNVKVRHKSKYNVNNVSGNEKVELLNYIERKLKSRNMPAPFSAEYNGL